MASAKQTSTRQSLRQHYRALRNQIPEAQRATAQNKICAALTDFMPLQKAQTIAAYTAQDGEPDVIKWLLTQDEQHKILGLPKVGAKGLMEFCRYHPQTTMHTNRYGISEPADSEVIAYEEIDAVITPLVAYDAAGHRLGMGGGYYDRFLARYTTPPIVIGIAFACQYIESLPIEDWDIPMQAIVTEQGVREIC